MLASHLRQNGFDYEAAKQEMFTWASEHCDPPFIGESDTEEWMRALNRVYEPEEPGYAGCTFIQQTLPHLCEENKCTIGQARLRRSQTRLTS
jgi:hypothetical protein